MASPGLWDPKSPRLLPSLVCFADILGFSKLTGDALEENHGDEFLKEIRRSLSRAYAYLRKSQGFRVGVPDFNMKVFTDNIVVGHPITSFPFQYGEPELGTLLYLFSRLQASLAKDGFFVRGAIACGDHYMDRDLAMGDAVLEAERLDKHGGAPRLIIAPSVEPLIVKQISSWYLPSQSPDYVWLLEDPDDGCLFINYLDVAFFAFPEGGVDVKLIKAHAKRIRENLSRYRDCKTIRKKYEWLATYHNFVCQEFANAHSSDYDGEGDFDEEAACYAEEAQRVLEHLVEVAPSTQAPRRISVDWLSKHVEVSDAPK